MDFAFPPLPFEFTILTYVSAFISLLFAVAILTCLFYFARWLKRKGDK